MAGKPRYTPKQVKDALIACNGLVYMAAEKLGCSSATICAYENRYPSIRKAVLARRGKRVDVAEAALDRAVLAGESWAIQFTLRTQGRDRGYQDKTEHDHRHSGEVANIVEFIVTSREQANQAIAALADASGVSRQ